MQFRRKCLRAGFQYGIKYNPLQSRYSGTDHLPSRTVSDGFYLHSTVLLSQYRSRSNLGKRNAHKISMAFDANSAITNTLGNNVVLPVPGCQIRKNVRLRLSIICDMIKGNESDVGNIDLELQAKRGN